MRDFECNMVPLIPLHFHWNLSFETNLPHFLLSYVSCLLLVLQNCVFLQLFNTMRCKFFKTRKNLMLFLLIHHGRLEQLQIFIFHHRTDLHIRLKFYSEGVLIHLLNDLKWFVSNRLEFICFSLQSFLTKIEPHLVSNT
jgi:hypothetical protein